MLKWAEIAKIVKIYKLLKWHKLSKFKKFEPPSNDSNDMKCIIDYDLGGANSASTPYIDKILILISTFIDNICAISPCKCKYESF